MVGSEGIDAANKWASVSGPGTPLEVVFLPDMVLELGSQ